MFAFKAENFDEVLPEIRNEIRKSVEASGNADEQFFILTAEEYALLRNRKVIKLAEAPVEFLDEIVRRLDATIAEMDAAEKAS